MAEVHSATPLGMPAELAAALEVFDSVASLLAAVDKADEAPGAAAPMGGPEQKLTAPTLRRRVRLEGVTVLDKRKVSRDRLCFCTVSDRTSAGARLQLRLGAGSGLGDLQPPAAAALAIRGCRVGTVVGAVEGVLGRGWAGSNGGLMLSCERVMFYDSDGQLPASSSGQASTRSGGGAEAGWTGRSVLTQPTLLFDLNYADQMTGGEFEGLCRQLRLSVSANRRSAHAFRMCFAGKGLSPPPGQSYEAAAAEAEAAGMHHWRSAEPKAPMGCVAAEGAGAGEVVGNHGSELWRAAAIERWDRWAVELLDDPTPWARPEFAPPPSDGALGKAALPSSGRVIYLAAESPNELDTIEPGCTFVIGGLVRAVPFEAGRLSLQVSSQLTMSY